MKKLLIVAAAALLVMIYVLLQQLNFVEITTFFVLFIIAGLSLGVLVGLFTADKALLLQEKRLKEQVKKAEQRVKRQRKNFQLLAKS